jgi:cysteine desulfurase/selenocysteine lyase
MTSKKLNIKDIRNDFPILSRKINGKQLIYFDNAATTQKPNIVVDGLSYFYKNENANIHRGVYTLSEHATDEYEYSRLKIKEFLNAKSVNEIIFTKGTTDGINLLAEGMCRGGMLNEGDEIIITAMEHHANIVPWQLICNGKIKLKVIPITKEGELVIEEYNKLFSAKTKLVAVTHTSNALGTINPVKKIISIAHEKDIHVLVDGAQAVAHQKIDVQNMDCDFFVFSGHKLFGPTGIGILYGKEELLNKLPPYQGGGDMIDKVTFEKSTFADLPNKFEAGTPNIAGAIGLGVAVRYLKMFDFNEIRKYETELLEYATDKMKKINGVEIIGNAENKAAVISFAVKGIHPYDIGTLMNTKGIALRTGHHCSQPLMNRLNLPNGTARISFSFYNTKEEIDLFIESLIKIMEMLS